MRRGTILEAITQDMRQVARSEWGSQVLRACLTKGAPVLRNMLMDTVLQLTDTAELVRWSCHPHASYVMEDILQVRSWPPPAFPHGHTCFLNPTLPSSFSFSCLLRVLSHALSSFTFSALLGMLCLTSPCFARWPR